MLARIAHDLYWLGRHLVRAEHTARMLDGLFHADLQGRPDDPASVTLSWESLLVIMGAGEIDGPARRDEVVRVLTTDDDNPVYRQMPLDVPLPSADITLIEAWITGANPCE